MFINLKREHLHRSAEIAKDQHFICQRRVLVAQALVQHLPAAPVESDLDANFRLGLPPDDCGIALLARTVLPGAKDHPDTTR